MTFEDTKSTWVLRDEDNHIISIPDGLAGIYAASNVDKIVFEAELTGPQTFLSETTGNAKFICTGFNCAVYVFGASANGLCPECGYEGAQVNPDMVGSFLEWYETARFRPIHNS